MRSRVALILTVLASLIWVVALPLWIAQYALHSPTFCMHWLREGDVVARFTTALANELPRQVPEAYWWPWLPRSPEELRLFFDFVLAPVDIETALAEAAPSWAGWALGEVSSPRPFTPAVARYLHGAHGDSARAFLWRALPSCESASAPACVPLDPGARTAVGEQQRLWWDGFVEDFITLLGDAESRFVDAWPGPPDWWRWVWYTPLVALVFAAIAAALMPSGRARWASFSVPLLTGGLIVGGVGALAAFGHLSPPGIWTAAGTPWADIGIAMFPALWRASTRALGPLFVIGGAFSLALGLSFAGLIFEGWWSKVFSIAAVLAVLWSIAQVYPVSALAPLDSQFVPPPEPTSTPRPTFTSTPALPTLTPTPEYWPVQEGTPVPTPHGPFTVGAQRLGCYQEGDAPVIALSVIDGMIRTLQSETTSRRNFVTLETAGSVVNAMPVATFALSHSGEEIALADERDLYVYAFPSWLRVLRSRVSTFSRIQTPVYVIGQSQLVLGLENGVLWVVKPATGGIVWLLPTDESAITALAAHPKQPLVLSGSADGTVRLWDMLAGEERAVLRGHDAAVEFIAFAPQTDLALSVDAGGLWTLWDLTGQRILRQRRLLPDATLTALVWDEDGMIAGTSQGDLVFVTEDFDADVLHVSDAAVTALTLMPSGYALIGTATGQVCVWGALAR